MNGIEISERNSLDRNFISKTKCFEFLAHSHFIYFIVTQTTKTYQVGSVHVVVVRLAGTASIQVLDRLSHLAIGLASKLINAITAVKRATDLFVSLDKALELNSQVSVLINQHAAVVLKSIDF
jgi:hypothetical protein